MELYASYTYHSMALYFDRDDVALQGFSKYFAKQSQKKRERGENLMKYQNKRRGKIALADIKKPETDEWGTGTDAIQAALDLEKTVHQTLLDLQKIADTHNDAQMMDFIESEYLMEQVNVIKEMSDHVTNLKRVGTGLGEYQFHRDIIGSG